ncbi:hypothetical protein OsI_39108 [Oryza sativa Indica Group]|uniref:Fungal lipase-type domain-containing protein n=1 Tax=Oryza sativa subsp. indica TaxID=39946 RepID=A2ZMQ2_ORYSI|nr:hypothetical protein OsI_39108 [Oryza sativa Indica Group]
MAAGDKGSLLAGFATFLQLICGGGGGGEDYQLPIDHNHPDHKADILMYGDMVEAAYKAFAGDDDEKEVHYYGGGGYLYLATTNLYATIDAVPAPLEAALPVLRGVDKPYWFGYVAAAWRGGYWDVVVPWRGSVNVADWSMNIQFPLVPFKPYTSKDKGIGCGGAAAAAAGEVEKGFHKVREDPGVGVRVTMAGHSLGGALALMAAHDVAAALADDDVPVRAVTFGAPRVGDGAFRDALIKGRHVDVVSLVVKQDLVPRLPPGHRYVQVTEKVVELVVDDAAVAMSLSASHSLEQYLHLFRRLCDDDGQAFAAPHDGGEVAPEKKNKWPEMEEEADGYKRLPLSELDKLITK